MPLDAKFPFEFNDRGDIASSDGEDFYRRAAMQLCLLAAEETGPTVATHRGAIELKKRAEFLLSDSPFFEEPATVTIQKVTGTTVQFSVSLPRLTDPVEVTV